MAHLMTVLAKLNRGSKRVWGRGCDAGVCGAMVRPCKGTRYGSGSQLGSCHKKLDLLRQKSLASMVSYTNDLPDVSSAQTPSSPSYMLALERRFESGGHDRAKRTCPSSSSVKCVVSVVSAIQVDR